MSLDQSIKPLPGCMIATRQDFNICYDDIGQKIVACGGHDPYKNKMVDSIEVYDMKECIWTDEGKL